MEKRNLGKDGPSVAAIGYGAMVLEGYYGQSDDAQGIATIAEAMKLGMMIDTADGYGNGHNEELVGRALAQHDGKAFIATKLGVVFDESEEGTEFPTNWGFSLTVNGRPEYVSKAIDASLRRLGVDTIDLLYLHFPDPAVPIEETVGAMAEAVGAGKVAYLGLSNVTAEQTRWAHGVHPIAAVQYEYSLWRREVEAELLPSLRELGISLVAWSPLGAGFLAGAMNAPAEGDFRQNNPRFTGKNLTANRDRFAPLLDLAREIGATPAQLALSWLLHQGADIIPIPGTRQMAHLRENADAEAITLSADVLAQIDRLAQPGATAGGTLL
jgi:aryl-alcohol dehydrogenase-like predicted oxidoreductase